jgi:hypothetical protein
MHLTKEKPMGWKEVNRAMAEAQQNGRIVQRLSSEEVAKRAEQFYREQLRPQLDPARKGDHLVINGETLAYEVDKNEMDATLRLLEKDPTCGPHLHHIKIGYELTVRMVPVYREESE